MSCVLSCERAGACHAIPRNVQLKDVHVRHSLFEVVCNLIPNVIQHRMFD